MNIIHDETRTGQNALQTAVNSTLLFAFICIILSPTFTFHDNSFRKKERLHRETNITREYTK